MLEAIVMTPDRSGQTHTGATGTVGTVALKEVFERLGLKVSVYNTLDIGLGYLSVRPVDVVFCDVALLPVNRPDLAQKLIQTLKVNKKCTLIFLASPEERGRLRGGLPFHDAEVVLKPLSSEAVSKVLVKLRPGEFQVYRKAN